MAALRLEIDRYAAVEVVNPLDDAKAPRAVEDERPLHESDETLEPEERLVHGRRAEGRPVDEREENPVVRGLFQSRGYRVRLQVFRNLGLVGADDFHGALEIAFLGALVQLCSKFLHICHFILR